MKKKPKQPKLSEQHITLEIKALFLDEGEAKCFAVAMAKNIGIAMQHSEHDRKIDHEFAIKIALNAKPVGVVIGEPKDVLDLLKKAVMGQSPPKPPAPKVKLPKKSKDDGSTSFSA